jgi:AraC-like DNA-binding protein
LTGAANGLTAAPGEPDLDVTTADARDGAMKQVLADATLPAVMVNAVVDAAVRRGLTRAEVAPAGLELGSLAPDALVPIPVMFAIFETIMRRLRDPGFALELARSFQLEHYPVLGFAVMTAPTSREAILRAGRFGALVTRSAQWRLVERRDVAELIWDRSGPRTLGHRIANESAVAEIFSGMKQSLGRPLRALAVRFRHAAPEDVSAHERFFGCPVTWNADRDALTLDAAILDEAPRFANLALSGYFEQEATRRVAALSTDDSMRARVADLLREGLTGGEPSLAKVAKRLAVGERTLRRALETEQTSFRAVLDEVRKEQATAMLEDRQLSLAEIAFALGFSEHAAFTRAFKRWFGRSPADARRAGGQSGQAKGPKGQPRGRRV